MHDIPYGKTTYHQDQSNRLNNPNGIWAIAIANTYSKIAIIIPCHRIIGKDGKLTGYGADLDHKRWLLDFGRQNSQVEAVELGQMVLAV